MSLVPTPHASHPPTVPGTPASGVSALTSMTAAVPDLLAAGELLATMKQTLSALGATFDSLGAQTARVAALRPAIEAMHQIHVLRMQLAARDRRQEDRMEEVKVLLRDVLKEQIAEHLRAHVRLMVEEQVKEQVKVQIKKQLLQQIPESLREQVRDHKRQIQEVQRSLHNSEARRENSLLRSTQLTDPLQPLLLPNGEACAIFPKDLSTLFGLSAATAKQLVHEYQLKEVEGEMREIHLNRFMAHIGVVFQVVPVPSMPSSSHLPLITSS